MSRRKAATDDYVFRAAALRNIERTAPYFHSGQVWSVVTLPELPVEPSAAPKPQP